MVSIIASGLLDASCVPPGCLLCAFRKIHSKIHNPEIDDLLVKHVYLHFLNFLVIRLVPYSNLSHSLFNPHLSSLVPLNIVQVEVAKHGFKFKTDEKPKKYNMKYTKSRFWDVGIEFRDVGCVRTPFAINSNPFPAHSD